MAAKGNRNTKSSAGDFTGKKKAELAAEHVEELKSREQEIALSAEQRAEENQEVVDLTQGGVPGQPLGVTKQPGQPGNTTTIGADGVMDVTDQDGRNYKIKTNDTEVTGIGTESPSSVPGETPLVERTRGVVDTRNAAKVANPESGAGGGQWASVDQRSSVVPQDVGVQIADTSVEIRVNSTLENVTIGQGTDYTFEEGRRYKVPQHVADHLEERGLVWH